MSMREINVDAGMNPVLGLKKALTGYFAVGRISYTALSRESTYRVEFSKEAAQFATIQLEIKGNDYLEMGTRFLFDFLTSCGVPLKITLPFVYNGTVSENAEGDTLIENVVHLSYLAESFFYTTNLNKVCATYDLNVCIEPCYMSNMDYPDFLSIPILNKYGKESGYTLQYATDFENYDIRLCNKIGNSLARHRGLFSNVFVEGVTFKPFSAPLYVRKYVEDVLKKGVISVLHRYMGSVYLDRNPEITAMHKYTLK